MLKKKNHFSDVHTILEPLTAELGLNWAQIEALRLMTQDLDKGHKRVYSDIAMGVGKSAIELIYMEACFRANIGLTGIITTNGQDDVLNLLENEAPKWAPELYKSGQLSHYTPSKGQSTPFNVATHTSVTEGLKTGALRIPSVMGIDEAQGALSDLRKGLFQNVEAPIFALTATPAYSLKKSLDSAGYKLSYKLPFEEAVARSLLSSYRNILLEVEDPYRQIDEIEMVRGDYDLEQIEKLMRHQNVMETVAHFIANWRHPDTGQTFFERKGLISCCSVMHAAYVAKGLAKLFDKQFPRGQRFIEPIWSSSKYAGTMSRDDRNAIIARHRSGSTRFVSTKDLLLTGHNDPTIDTVLNLRPTASMVLVPQRGGRAVRFDHSDPNKEAYIIDVLLESDRSKQMIFADYAGRGFIETLERQKWREERGPRPYERVKPPVKINHNDAPTPYKVYYDQREVRSYILSREKREAIAKRPWLSTMTPSLLTSLIRQDIQSIDHIVKAVGEFAIGTNWDEDMTKSRGKGGALSKSQIIKALTGGFIAERRKENKDHFDKVSKRWKRASRKLEQAKVERWSNFEELQKKLRVLDEDLRLPLNHTYTLAEVAISSVLGGHASTLFGDIKTPEPKKKEDRKFKTKRDTNGEKIKINGVPVKIIPEGKKAIRSAPAGQSAYEPDHMFGLDNPIASEFVSEKHNVQKNFVDLFHNAVWASVEEHDALNPDSPILPNITHEDAETYIRSIIDELLITKLVDGEEQEFTKRDENNVRRFYQRREAPSDYDELSISPSKWPKSISVTSLEFEFAAFEGSQPLMYSEPDLDSVMNQLEAEEILASALSSLTPREERVLRMRYGMGSKDLINDSSFAMTLEDAGVMFGVTRERIRQMEAKAIRKLKHPSRTRRLASLLSDGAEFKHSNIVAKTFRASSNVTVINASNPTTHREIDCTRYALNNYNRPEEVINALIRVAYKVPSDDKVRDIAQAFHDGYDFKVADFIKEKKRTIKAGEERGYDDLFAKRDLENAKKLSRLIERYTDLKLEQAQIKGQEDPQPKKKKPYVSIFEM